ncbi:hypothetical protein [Flavobacterium sp. W21_SRS_FM6]|uniref:hypothetical protein n=1 Tax=Flavobacterium sp. W21_SRS_FM6 TaxID=3240268 RepID=UPI003F929DFA
MNTPSRIALLVLIPFVLLSFYAVFEVGYWGIIAPLLNDSAGWQVLADLIIALVLVLIWLIKDAKLAKRNPWPWILLTLLLGSIGPMLYIVLYKTQAVSPSS